MANFELKELTGNIDIYPLIRTKDELFSTTVMNSYKQILKELTDSKTKLTRKADIFIINANWYDVSYSGILNAKSGSNPVPAEETTNLGLIYKNGRITSGTSAKDGYYISFYKSRLTKGGDMRLAFKMGVGNPSPHESMTASFGDIGPLIINNLPYGSTNLYLAGTSNKAPLIGEPPIGFKNNLKRRSSKKFGQFAAKDKDEGYTKGKTCIGVCSSKVIIGVQQDGIKGPSLDGIRDYFVKQNCQYAVFFDGSDSAMLFENGKFKINMGEDKNELCTAGIILIKYY